MSVIITVKPHTKNNRFIVEYNENGSISSDGPLSEVNACRTAMDMHKMFLGIQIKCKLHLPKKSVAVSQGA